MDRQIYEPPEMSYETPQLTVLGSVSGLTEQKEGGTPDQNGLDGASSFTFTDV